MLYISTHTRIQTHTYMHAYIHILTYTCMYTFTYTYTCIITAHSRQSNGLGTSNTSKPNVSIRDEEQQRYRTNNTLGGQRGQKQQQKQQHQHQQQRARIPIASPERKERDGADLAAKQA